MDGIDKENKRLTYEIMVNELNRHERLLLKLENIESRIMKYKMLLNVLKNRGQIKCL